MPTYKALPRTSGGKHDYWYYNVPILGNKRRGKDERAFWEDYYKKYGKRPKYGGRHYAAYDRSAFYEAMAAAGSIVSLANRAYRFAR